MREIKLETFKAKERRIREGFFLKYCNGIGLDIGYGGDLLASNCDGWDAEDGDAQYMEGVERWSYDFVYSSHLLEEMDNIGLALKKWWALVKPGGYFILYVPHRDLYEKRKRLPSRWNPGHKHFFLPLRAEPPDTVNLLGLIIYHLGAEHYRLVYAKVCDEGHTITDPDKHSNGEYSIEIVLRKEKR